VLPHLRTPVLTVRASLNAVPTYLRYGFVLDGDVGEFNGLVYQQMVRAAAQGSGCHALLHGRISKLNQHTPRPFLQWPVTPFEMLPMRVALSVLLLASALSACTPAPVSTANSAEAPAPASAIAWRQGDVDDAFAEAADGGKPVLLYWGAVWCPPCNQLKAGLFKDPAFIALTGKFVPVYLDGDEEGAQAWGERFGVRGYPTLIVLDPQRNELTRVAGGNDAAELTRALTVAAGRRSAIAATLATALATPDRLAAEDWQVLGDYGWEVDANRLAGERRSQDVLRQLSKAAPDAALQRRFALLALATADTPPARPPRCVSCCRQCWRNLPKSVVTANCWATRARRWSSRPVRARPPATRWDSSCWSHWSAQMPSAATVPTTRCRVR
jgi:protein disulfide-isomerase